MITEEMKKAILKDLPAHTAGVLTERLQNMEILEGRHETALKSIAKFETKIEELNDKLKTAVDNENEMQSQLVDIVARETKVRVSENNISVTKAEAERDKAITCRCHRLMVRSVNSACGWINLPGKLIRVSRFEL